jgi:hypothetical protein
MPPTTPLDKPREIIPNPLTFTEYYEKILVFKIGAVLLLYSIGW